MHLMLKTFKDLPLYVADCEHVTDDLQSLEEWSTVFTPFSTFKTRIEANIKTHLPKLSLDLAHARKDLKNEEYFAFGEQLG